MLSKFTFANEPGKISWLGGCSTFKAELKEIEVNYYGAVGIGIQRIFSCSTDNCNSLSAMPTTQLTPVKSNDIQLISLNNRLF